MLRHAHLVALSLLLASCGGGGGSAEPPEDRLGCSEDDEAFLPVTVLDAIGAPAAGAEVTATNQSTSPPRTVTTTTNSQGTTSAVGESLGSGTIRIVAQLGSKTSEPRQATFTCGECSCTFDPRSITLQLRP